MAYLDKINVKGTEYDIQDSNAARQTEVDELKSAYDELYTAAPKKIVAVANYTTAENKRVSVNSSNQPVELDATGYLSVKFDHVISGSKYYLTGMVNLNSTYCIVNIRSDGTAYKYEDYRGGQAPVTDYEYVIPDDTVKLWLTSNITTGFSAKIEAVDTLLGSAEKADIDQNSVDITYINLMDSGNVSEFGGLNMMARLGYKGNVAGYPYEQTHKSYMLAYDNGYKIMICDLCLTADNEFVCLHDANINTQARNLDGSVISSTIAIADITLAQANTYDYGIVRGEGFSQVGITTIKWMLEFCKYRNIICHIELKVYLDDTLAKNLANLIKMYGMQDKVMFNFSYSQYSTSTLRQSIVALANALPNAPIGYVASKITSGQLGILTGLSIGNPKFLFLTNYSSVTDENVLLCAQANVDIAYTEIRTEEQMTALYNSGSLKYLRYLSSQVNVYDFCKAQEIE